MATYSTNYTRAAAQTPDTTSPTARTTSTKDRITHDEFLQLLVMQLTHQDPLKPMEDIDFMGQMAQMQALDEQITMTKTMTNMRIDTQIQSTSSLIGKIVSGVDTSGSEASGVVDRVVVEEDTVYAQLENGLKISAENIAQVYNQTDTLRNDLMGAQAMIGMMVTALDSNYQTIQGVAQKATIDSKGQIYLQLHDGKKVLYNDVYEVSDWYIDENGGTSETDGGS